MDNVQVWTLEVLVLTREENYKGNRNDSLTPGQSECTIGVSVVVH